MMDIEKLKSSQDYKRVLSLVESVSNKEDCEIIKVNLYRQDPFEYVPVVFCNEIKAYGFRCIMLLNTSPEVKVKDIIDQQYIKSVEIFNPLDTENYKYIK